MQNLTAIKQRLVQMRTKEQGLASVASVVKTQTYAGLFMVALATLMYEILLTRIFSVTMWYHFAFMAISVALFGMTVGAILVYLWPNYFTHERTKYHLALSSLLFALSIVITFLTHLSIPFPIEISFVAVYAIVLTYVVISVPFVFSGICVTLALTRFPRHVSRLYAADLAGAALGCILLVYALRITDGPTAVILVAFLASLGAVLFAAGSRYTRLVRIALLSTLVFGFVGVAHTALVNKQRPIIRLMWVKGGGESRPLYEQWNSFSRVRVSRDPIDEPLGWGLSPVYPVADRKVQQLSMKIDASAATILTAFDGNLDDLQHLKYDITNFAHYLRSDSKVLVVGAGGGRDILSALAFEQEAVLGVEMNGEIIDTVNRRFGDFTGHLDTNPKVSFVNDEARSYIARLRDRFDIIQVSLIDTWAATAAGAFVLSENSLYTVEAWEIFLDHLTPNGILTVSRWYFRDRPAEMYRLTTLATASLTQRGVENPRNHIVIVRRMRGESPDAPDGIGTMLVSTEPFSDKDLDTIENIAGQMQFDLILSPRYSADANFATIASGADINQFVANFPLNIAAPTDDSPFFFNMLRLRDVFNRDLSQLGMMSFNLKAVTTLGILFITVIVLTFLCIIVPLILTTDKATLEGSFPYFVFFASIGLGFMLIEISQLQRLIIFLGHPTYSLSVVLFTLLLSSGIGSYSTQRINGEVVTRSAAMRLLFLLCLLILFGWLTPDVIRIFQSSTTMLRALVAIAILFPLGLFMGMAFPLGMTLASTRSTALTPWLWGINGATSVCASVLAVVIALGSSISASFWIGFLCYVLAFGALVWAGRGNMSLAYRET